MVCRIQQSNRQILSEIALNLNAFYGPNRTAAKWEEVNIILYFVYIIKKYPLWSLSNWKKQLRARARKLKAERLRTCGGSFSGEELSEFDEQALSAFGMGAVNG
ncbi:unnamed protein product [Ceratitis capitata]|uniref:(Mediterranean fruit fly) hypothetical protein n=1 Tax=Ceratitis capitata TaxID=7213 RepID=A0A811UVZ7_CERCA|nr:unnamed protein product [Ceratitis capitata]